MTANPLAPAAAAPAASPVAASEASIVFGSGRSPEEATRVQLADFEGPLGLLLTLIEARKLDVLTVPLAQVAEAYLDALATIPEDPLGNISSFVAVASQLILIKSRAMLPRPPATTAPGEAEAPDPEAELRARLILYRSYRNAGAALASRAAASPGLFHREASVAVGSAKAGARPEPALPLPPELLVRALDRLVRSVPPPPEPPGWVPRTIRLIDRAAIIRAALRNADSVVLQDLLKGVRDRVVLAITFLALLELMKRGEVMASQSEPWGPIEVRRIAAPAALPAAEAVEEDEDDFGAGFGAEPTDADDETTDEIEDEEEVR